MSTIQNLYVGNDNVLEVASLKDDTTGEFLNSATVSVTLKNASTGVNVVGETWPLNMSYITDSNGIFRCSLKHELELLAGQQYNAVITADGGVGLYASFTVLCVARARN
jgi:hypothetical protein